MSVGPTLVCAFPTTIRGRIDQIYVPSGVSQQLITLCGARFADLHVNLVLVLQTIRWKLQADVQARRPTQTMSTRLESRVWRRGATVIIGCQRGLHLNSFCKRTVIAEMGFRGNEILLQLKNAFSFAENAFSFAENAFSFAENAFSFAEMLFSFAFCIL